MRFQGLALGLLVVTVSISGCFGGGGGEKEDAGSDERERTVLRMSPPSGYQSAGGDSGGDAGAEGAGGESGKGRGSGGASEGGEGDSDDDPGSTGGSSSDPDDPDDGAPGDPSQSLLGGLPVAGYAWNEVSSVSGVGYDASGFFQNLPPLDLQDPQPPSGGDLEGWDPASLLASLDAQGEVGGFRFAASSIRDGEVRNYDVSVQAEGARSQLLRSLLLSPDDFVAYVDAGGDLVDVAGGESALSGAAVHEDSFRVLPLTYVIEGDDGSRAQVVLYLPLDVENPAAYWAPVGMAYDDGVHAGSWEFAPRSPDDLPRLRDGGGRVAVPYMAGDSVEELASWDILLALHGLHLFAHYPAQGVPLPSPGELPGVVERAASDPSGWLFEQVDDPTGLTDQQFYVFGHDVTDVEGLQADYRAGFQVHHEQRTEDQRQWFRVGFAPGLPVPTLIEIGSQQDGHSGHAVRIDLRGVGAEALDSLPGVVPLPGLPNGLPLPV